jgi:hypothetical protein
MNELQNLPKKKMNFRAIYMGIVIAGITLLIGGIIDDSHVFGEGSAPIIQGSAIMITGFVMGVAFISANTGVKVKELLC